MNTYYCRWFKKQKAIHSSTINHGGISFENKVCFSPGDDAN